MSYSQSKLNGILDSIESQEYKSMVESYFSKDNKYRRTIFNVLYNDLSRINPVISRDRFKTIIRDFEIIGFHPNYVLPDPPFEDVNIQWTASEFHKFIWMKGDSTNFWNNKKICEVGTGSGSIITFLSKLGALCAGYEQSSEEVMMTACNAILHNVEINLVFDLATIDNIDTSHDIYIFSRVFYGERFAQENLNLARYLRSIGKEVLISSKTLVENTNQLCTLSPSEYEFLLNMKFSNDPDNYGNRYVIRLI